MTEYTEEVNLQRAKLIAEEWKDKVESVHIHSLKSMWYDDRPADTDNGAVTDTRYNDGRIERSKNGKVIHIFDKEQVKGKDLVDLFLRKNL